MVAPGEQSPVAIARATATAFVRRPHDQFDAVAARGPIAEYEFVIVFLRAVTDCPVAASIRCHAAPKSLIWAYPTSR